MAIVRPFKGIRPRQDIAHRVASLPYDVMNREEAKEMSKANAQSFLHVIRPEIDLDDCVDIYDKSVYEKARENLDKMILSGTLIQDTQPKLYIYRQIMLGRVQTGIVGCTSIDDYLNNIIKKHEHTRLEKEEDRINNFDYCDANTAPVFLTYRKNENINHIVSEWIKFHKPIYDFKSEDGIMHIVWDIDDKQTINRICSLFNDIGYFYIADGHHRSASAVKVGQKRREENPNYTGEEEFNYFMSVLFPDEDLFILDYNRVVRDLNGYSIEEFMHKINERFIIEEYTGKGQFKPYKKHTFGMYIERKWYILIAKKGTYNESDPVQALDVSILQNNILYPILGIQDLRTDDRIDFVGGIRGLGELEKRTMKDMKVAFSMYPTTMEELMSIADNGQIMPPKSTWFEPKLRSGLFVHRLF